MVDRTAALEVIHRFIGELTNVGYTPDEVYLFGSCANGIPNRFSDIDVAVWDSKFSGCLPFDIENVKSILSRYSLIELHTFNSKEKDNPYIHEIKTKGIRIIYIPEYGAYRCGLSSVRMAVWWL